MPKGMETAAQPRTGAARGWRRLREAFHKAGSPRWFFAGCRAWMIGLYAIGAPLVVVGAVWGLAFVPPDRLQGDSFRILFVHVPAVHVAQSVYYAIAVAAVVYLVWRMKMADMVIAVGAPIGLAITAAALLTGIIWGIPTWGTGWVWDARTVSTLVLLILFFGLTALRQAVVRPQRAALAVALLALVGVVNLPIIKYSVDWFATLHQPPSIRIGQKPAIAAVFLWPLALTTLGYYCLAVAAGLAGLRALIVDREAGADWVRQWLARPAPASE